MHKVVKIVLRILVSLCFIAVITVIIGQKYLKGELEKRLKNDLPETIKLTYSDLKLSLIQDYLEIQNVKISQYSDPVKRPNLEIDAKKIRIDNFSLWNYVSSEIIQIEDLILSEPHVVYHQNEHIPHEIRGKNKLNSFHNHVAISQIYIYDGRLAVYNGGLDSLKTEIKGIDVLMKSLTYNSETQKKQIPFIAESYDFQLDSLFFAIGDFENLTTGKTRFSNVLTTLSDFKLKTKYSKTELSRIISKERDHYNLEVDSVSFHRLNLGFVHDSTFFIKSPKILFYEPNFNVFRDKLVSDDSKIKDLYGKMLRNLKVDLALDTIEIKNANIKYSEKVRLDKPAGEITFSEFNALIENLGNTYESPVTTVLHIDTKFMEHAPLHVTWEFDVNNLGDEFQFKAEMGTLKANQLDEFTRPNFNKDFEGQLDKTYFTIFGNSEQSQIDLKVQYEYFDIVALKKNGREKNKLLSDIFNVFITKNSKKGIDGFVEVKRSKIQRNKTKSVFNYIWITTRAGLVKALTIE